MDTYDQAAQAASRLVTNRFSDSFSLASRLFAPAVRRDIYNIYGLVRLADEIADTYEGPDRLRQLDRLEEESADALRSGFSANLLVHTFALTGRRTGIGRDLTRPFFASMRTDIRNDYDAGGYQAYIHGSAEVVGLMCLRVFVKGNEEDYRELGPGAAALGSALQKVNFLRDLADDHERLGRYYFPIGSYEEFDEEVKLAIIRDIEHDFAVSLPAIRALPPGARPAVMTAYRYYAALLARLSTTPAERLKRQRVRLSNRRKLVILGTVAMREKLRG